MMIRLNNNIEIPQIGVGTWTLRGETARHQPDRGASVLVFILLSTQALVLCPIIFYLSIGITVFVKLGFKST